MTLLLEDNKYTEETATQDDTLDITKDETLLLMRCVINDGNAPMLVRRSCGRLYDFIGGTIFNCWVVVGACRCATVGLLYSFYTCKTFFYPASLHTIVHRSKQ